MNHLVFIAHAEEDKKLADELMEILWRIYVDAYVQGRTAEYGVEPLSDRIKNAIKDSEFFIAMLTLAGASSMWVNQEIGFAEGVNVGVIPLKTKNVNLSGFIEHYKYLPFDPTNPNLAFGNLLIMLRNRFKIEKARGICPNCHSEVVFSLESQEELNKLIEKDLVYVQKCPECKKELEMEPRLFKVV